MIISVILCGLVGLVAFILACIEDELVKIRQMMEEERYE